MAAQHPFVKRLGRRPRYDYRNLRMSDFITPGMRALAATVTEKVWELPEPDDQGDTPECVGFSWNNNGNAEPVEEGWPNSRGDEIYAEAKKIDKDGQDGSSTLSGVKAFMKFTMLENNKYAFASAVEDIKVWLLTKAPVVTGTTWTWDMFEPDSNGVVHPTGGSAGGHEWLIVGYNRSTDMFKCANSWGTSWGLGGFFYISASDYAALMADQGDACCCVEVAPVPVPTPTPVPVPAPVPVSTVKQQIIDLLQALLDDRTVPLPKWLHMLLTWLVQYLQGA